MRVPLAWSGDVTMLARALAAVAGTSSSGAWFWLDGGGEPGGEGWSYLGVADEVIEAERGIGGEFLERIRAASGMSSEEGFAGGWVVALGYEFGVELLGLEGAGESPAPAFALRSDTVIAYDHSREAAELRGSNARSIECWLKRLAGASDAATERTPGAAGSEARRGVGAELNALAAPEWRRSAEQYRADVDSCRAEIAEGEAYVLCLTDTATVPLARADPLSLYLGLRTEEPALRGGVISAGGRALVSASPERFLSVRGSRVSTHPIKGTRQRGANAAEDAALAAELGEDAKERAENLMIVDLMRNDLSRVCVPGTVAVTDFLRVETHRHVHQLVSTISGELLPGRGAVDALASCFPGGSMTGAPKHRAVELLAALERAPRGLYSGCFGWIDRGGAAELAMTIRSIELRGIDCVENADDAAGSSGIVALVGAGGGITIDSDPTREQIERDLKAAPLLAALSDDSGSRSGASGG